jgi:murein DD-endopeptidase MepM/ murein hydrolase activator NlpD
MIKKVTDKYMDRSLVQDFNINIFKRLKGSRTAAGFAEKRSYFHNDNEIDEAWHLGMDWASIKQAPIKTSNNGTVIFNQYLGIYGNTIIIDHKMGLSTLYAHVSSSSVNVGDKVSKNQKIANTGSTGAVLGDHLHFGVLIQGIEVNPKEWMDRNWIKSRITDILDDAKKIIDSK